MKHIVKTVSRFLLLSLTLGCGLFALQTKNHSWTANYAEEGSSTEKEKTYTEADFAGEVEASSEELEISLVQNNTTSTSQSLNFTFKSKTLTGCYQTAWVDFIVSITDSAFTGNTWTPVEEGYERIDEKSKLPILDGEVLFILDDYNRGEGEVFIPSSFVLDKTFVINITAISSYCVRGSGEFYELDNKKNCWLENDGTTLKYNKIHIPSSVKTVHSHAFTGAPADMTICYEGSELPSGFAADWTDIDASKILLNDNARSAKWHNERNVTNEVNDVPDELGRPIDFCLGCRPDKKAGQGDEYYRPLVIQFDVIEKGSNPKKVVRTVFDTLPLSNTKNGSTYDSVGKISTYSNSRLLGYKIASNELIDADSIVFHNIMKFSSGANIDLSQGYFAKPKIQSHQVLDISSLISFKASSNSTFAGYSMFSLTMDKNLGITSEQYPEEHSLYLDVKSDFYELNKTRIQDGLTEIRYSLYNLYLSSYRFEYLGKDGQLKEAVVPISTVISYQILENDKDNKVSVLVKDSDVADDFSADRVKTFELTNITIQMDLFATSDTGSKSVLAKSQISYKFAYITVLDNENIKVFNWNVFLIIFLVAYVAFFVAASFGLYKISKEKFKNDEFRRVNGKKFLKSAALYGVGSLVIAYAIIFIIMRTTGFANTIVTFNPVDPLLIAFAIAGMIIGGYFIVLAIKAIKIEKERRKAIRLKLNEDVVDDGTN